MIVRNLGSGSGGNATVVSEGDHAILIDAGLSKRRMLAGLDGLKLDGVLVSHCHGDHLKPYAADLGGPVWLDENNLESARCRDRIEKNYELFGEGDPFRVGPFRIEAFPLPHPGFRAGWNNFGFIVESRRRRFVYATDTGRVTDELLEAVKRGHVVLLESNHDPELELNSSRPHQTKEWILSDYGHLSNDQCADALTRATRAHAVILGHLSGECNRPELARKGAKEALRRGVRVTVARQGAPSEALTV